MLTEPHKTKSGGDIMFAVISATDRQLVEDYFKHMQAGSLEEMVSPFR
jgi:hypothetical protein